MKMTEQQKLDYKLYCKACRINNVEPTRADFLAGDIPSHVINEMELESNEREWSPISLPTSVSRAPFWALLLHLLASNLRPSKPRVKG